MIPDRATVIATAVIQIVRQCSAQNKNPHPPVAAYLRDELLDHLRQANIEICPRDEWAADTHCRHENESK
jgi:hypothetical protein